MALCEVEEALVRQLTELIADLQPDADMRPAERASIIRERANAVRRLASAQADLRRCREAHTWYGVRLHVVRMADDDGSNGTNLTTPNVEEYVSVANRVFAPARVEVSFDPATDLETRNNSRLNQLVEGSGLQVDADAVADAERIGDEFPGQVVVICRKSRALAAPPVGGCGAGCGYSWFPGKYVMMPAFDANSPPLFAHELGHYFGLPHTFRYVIDTTPDARVVFDLLGRNLAAIENDSPLVSDTAAEMIIRDQNAGNATQIDFSGQIIAFLRDNIMSYYRPLAPDDKAITAGQATVVRSVVNQRRSQGLAVNDVLR